MKNGFFQSHAFPKCAHRGALTVADPPRRARVRRVRAGTRAAPLNPGLRVPRSRLSRFPPRRTHPGAPRLSKTVQDCPRLNFRVISDSAIPADFSSERTRESPIGADPSERTRESPHRSQKLPDAPRSSQKLPEAPRSSQRFPDAPRAPRSSQKLPGAPRSSQALSAPPPGYKTRA